MHPFSIVKGLGNYCLYLGIEITEFFRYYPCPGEELKGLYEFMVETETERQKVDKERATKRRVAELVDII
jgi:hypothetical protein